MMVLLIVLTYCSRWWFEWGFDDEGMSNGADAANLINDHVDDDDDNEDDFNDDRHEIH